MRCIAIVVAGLALSSCSSCSNAKPPKNLCAGILCRPSDACHSAGTCDPSSGVCGSGPAISCDDSNSCTSDSCDPSTGCAHARLADGTACTEAIGCTSTQAKQCAAGACGCATVTVATSGSIVEDFRDGSSLDADASTAVIDPRDGGLAAPLDAYAPTGCVGDPFAPTANVTLDGGVHQYPSIAVPAGVSVIGDSSLDLRACGDVTLGPRASVSSTLSLRLVSGGSIQLGDEASVISGSVLIAALGDGGTLSLSNHAAIFAPNDSSVDSGVNALTILVNGDLLLDGGSIFLDPAGDLRVVAAGSLIMVQAIDSASIFADSPEAGTLTARVLGDLVLRGFDSVIYDSAGAPPASPGGMDIAVAGRVDGVGCFKCGAFYSGPAGILRLRARGDILLGGDGGSGDLYIGSDTYDGGRGSLVEVESLGTFSFGGRGATNADAGLLTVGDYNIGLTQPPDFGRPPNTPAGRMRVRAQTINLLDDTIVQVAGSGVGGAAGELSLVAGDGGLHFAERVSVQAGPSLCAPGFPVQLESQGDAILLADGGALTGTGTSIPYGVFGSSSRSQPGCSAGPGGDVNIAAFGSAFSVTVDAGDGAPPGNVTITTGASVDAGLAPIVFTEPFVALSRVYDLGAPAVVTAVTAATRVPAEGAVVLELAMADAPSGPFTTWLPASQFAALGAHRYLRWRATLDRFFLDTAFLDHLQIDWRRP